MGIIRRDLLNQIDEAKSRLDTSRIQNMTREVFRMLEDQVVENAAMQDGDNAERKELVMSNFEKAWDYSEKNFGGEFNLVYLTDVAGRVEPGINEPGKDYAAFRKFMVTWPSGYVPPADDARIRKHLERVVGAAESTKMHPVEKAVYYNFHLTRIQPFENGNKRTANIVMNSILRHNGFLPITIPQSKVGDFESFLVSAVEGFQKSGTKGDLDNPGLYLHPEFQQTQFYDFLARSELYVLRCAENKMAGMQSYEIKFESANPGAEYALKRKLEGYFRGQDRVHQVRLNEKEKRINITGEIPYRQLEKMVNEARGLKRTHIDVVKNDATQTHHG